MSAGDMAALEQNSLAGLELDARGMEHLPEARLISRLQMTRNRNLSWKHTRTTS